MKRRIIVVKFCSFLIPILLLCQLAQGQCFVPFTDAKGVVHLFDGKTALPIENKPLTSFESNRNGVFSYVIDDVWLKIYYKGQIHSLAHAPFRYFMTDYYFCFLKGDTLKVLEGNRFVTLESDLYGMGGSSDSLLMWYSNQNKDVLKVYCNGKIDEIKVNTYWRGAVGSNIIAYIDDDEKLHAYYHGVTYDLEEYAPSQLFGSDDMLIYETPDSTYKFFVKGKVYETRPKEEYEKWERARGFIVYFTKYRQMGVFVEGKEVSLTNDLPVKYTVKENFLVYTDLNNYFWCWYNGKKYLLERYVPADWEIEKDLLVYHDMDGRLKGLYHGEQVAISSQIVKYYKLYKDAVTYSLRSGETTIWCNKKTYTFH